MNSFTVYGYKSNGFVIPFDWRYHNGKGMRENQRIHNWTRTANVQIDLCFDGDHGTLKLCIVGDQEGTDVKIWRIPKGNYVPHVSIGSISFNCSIQCAMIPTDWYGKFADNIFV